MKIAIDISQVVYETGVSEYTKQLVEALTRVDNKNEYILFGGSIRRLGEIKSFIRSLKSQKVSAKLSPISPTIADIIWNRLHILGIEKLVGKVDVFHSSDWSQPPAAAFKVTTVHDLFHLKFPEHSNAKVVAAHKRRMRWVKREVDRVIVPSSTTEKDAISFGIEKGKIRVIPEAPSPMFKPASRQEVDQLKKKYNISGKYLMAVGVNERKNTKRIIEAFGALKDNDLELIVIGQKFIDLPEAQGVRFVGHVLSEERPVFYSGAQVLAYPSLHEGFGLPILEAMASGTPVVTSSTSSMPEIAGSAAVLVNPESVDSIADGIRKAMKNEKDLVQKGFARARQFSWQKAAKETLEVYNEVASFAYNEADSSL